MRMAVQKCMLRRDEHLPDEPRKAQAMPPGRPHFRAPPSGHGPNHGLHPGQSLQHQQLQPSPGSSPPGRRLTVKPPKSGARADVHATQQPADQGRNHLAGHDRLWLVLHAYHSELTVATAM